MLSSSHGPAAGPATADAAPHVSEGWDDICTQPRAKFDLELAESCLEEVAFDQGRDPDVESVEGLATHFQDWFDLETFRASGIMARAPLIAGGPALFSLASRCVARTRHIDVRFVLGGPRKVALRRWFSWTYAYERFDEQWTAARVVTRWLVEVLGNWVDSDEARFTCDRASVRVCGQPSRRRRLYGDLLWRRAGVGVCGGPLAPSFGRGSRGGLSEAC